MICEHLAASRPTAVNLFWAIARMKGRLTLLCGSKSSRQSRADLIKESQAFSMRTLHSARRWDSTVAELIQNGQTISPTATPARLRPQDMGPLWRHSSGLGSREKISCHSRRNQAGLTGRAAHRLGADAG